MASENFFHYIDYFNRLTSSTINHLLRKRNYKSDLLYRILPEYPSRKGKGIRPSLCLASCIASGGNVIDALNTAVAIELFHNAFLIKDDIEDGSEFRRKQETIVSKYGYPIAINVGDALAVLAINLLLENVDKIGVSKALRVLNEVQRMAQNAVEGQAMELEWIRKNEWNIANRDYYLMCNKKTCWYTAAVPCRVGTIIGSSTVNKDNLKSLTKFGLNLGMGFQIQDDILNLMGNKTEYGKEINGDLLEGKRTLIMIILFKNATSIEKSRIISISRKKRNSKTQEDIQYLRGLIDKYSCIDRSARISRRFIQKAIQVLEKECKWIESQDIKSFLEDMAKYVIERHI
jgi:geranylgeranyl diphosphate synthase, type II